MPRFSQRALFWPPVTQMKERKKKREHRGENEDMNAVKSGSEGRQQMGVDDNTHRSQQQRPRSPLHSSERRKGSSGGEEGRRRRWLGCWSAKIKRDPIIGITTSQ